MNTRLIVIEKTISIEEDISRLLGFLLNIDWKKSKSLGFSGSSLSFFQKIIIIQDIIRDGAEKKDIKKYKVGEAKLNCLIQIRNKFAHVKGIDTFEKLFSTTKVGEEIKKNLNKWYYPNYNEILKGEKRFMHYFDKLSADINVVLLNIAIDNAVKKALEIKSKQSDEIYAKAFQQKILKLPDGKKINNKIIDEVEEMLEKDNNSIVRNLIEKLYNVS